jgi:hypothetical protein
MSGGGLNRRVRSSNTKKLLRFGTDSPQCGDCNRSGDVRLLCRVKREGKPDLILCRNCKAKRTRPSPQATDKKANLFKEAGFNGPACIICNEPNLQVLELDHLAGEANSTFVEPLCANHHAVKSDSAESGAVAALRLRDPERTALAVEAAFDFGLASILAMMAVSDGTENASRGIFFAAVALLLVAWGLWNTAADSHFKSLLGPTYDLAIPAEIPR